MTKTAERQFPVGYCINCGCTMVCDVRAESRHASAHGITFRYIEESCFCTSCGKQVYVPDIEDANCARREEAYAKAKVDMLGELAATTSRKRESRPVPFGRCPLQCELKTVEGVCVFRKCLNTRHNKKGAK